MCERTNNIQVTPTYHLGTNNSGRNLSRNGTGVRVTAEMRHVVLAAVMPELQRASSHDTSTYAGTEPIHNSIRMTHEPWGTILDTTPT
jgi:hypothetical protein